MLSFYSEISLNSNQQKAVVEIEAFLSSDKDIFILKGYAGSGKTTLLKGIGSYLNYQGRLGKVMAPTGRAAKVIQNKTSLPATTIHKAIFNYENVKSIKEEGDDAKKSFKFYFDLAQNEETQDSVFIVDESSMIGDNFTEGEFFRFGSGQLLSDLLKYIDLHTSKNHKVIFIGDPAQLEPVGDKDSKALMESYFLEKGFSVSSTELTTVVRQEHESGILNNASYLRRLLDSKSRNENQLDTNYNDVEELKVEQVAKQYIDIVPVNNIGIGDAIVVAFSNDKVFAYNKMIREYYFPNQESVVPSDILLVTKNSYKGDVVLMNGELIRVVSVSEDLIEQSAPVMIDGERKQISLLFRSIEIQIPESGIIVPVMIIETNLLSKKRDLDSYEQKALYINFVMRFRQKYGNTYNEKSQQFKEALKHDPFFNALRVKFGYAVTCHKSQGGEWKNVFVDFSGRVGLSDSYLRWCYTAITRAERRLFVVNKPNLLPMSKLKISEIGKINKIATNMYNFQDVDLTPYHDESTHPAKRLKYFEIIDKIIHTKFNIERVDVKEWIDIYYFSCNNEVLKVDLNHNKAGEFTIRPNDKSNDLICLLQKKYEWNLPFNYQTVDPKLNFLFQNISSLLDDCDMKIINIDESRLESYVITYYFRTEANCSYIQFYFDAKGVITKGIAKSTLGKDDVKLTKLITKLVGDVI